LPAAAVLIVAASGAPLSAQEGASPTAIARYIDDVFATGAAAGISVAVVHGDSILLVRALGIADMATGRPVTPETRFLTASTTKALTALTAVLLDERGAIDLDASLAKLLPRAELDSALSARDITLRDLLAMRHGIGQDGPVIVRTAYTGEFDTPTLLRLLRHHGPSRAGRRFEYGNLGYNIAGLALEEATGRHWQDLVLRTVIRPLRMRETGSRISAVPERRLAMPHAMNGGRLERVPLYKSDRTMHAAGGHLTTARDLARFVIAQLNAGRVPGAAGVSARAIAEMRRRHTDQDREFSFLHRNGWGLGLDIADYRGDTIYQRPGSFTGYYSHMSFMPSRRVGIVVLTNGGIGGGGAAAETVVQGVYDMFRGESPATLQERIDTLRADVLARAAAPRPAPPPAPTLPPGRYLGRYADEQLGTLVIEQRGDSLVARMGDAWGVVSGIADTANVLTAPLMGGRRRLEFTFSGGEPAVSVAMAGRTFRRTR
jgi:CubicO group peptidase (beta-lactamase class C family)